MKQRCRNGIKTLFDQEGLHVTLSLKLRPAERSTRIANGFEASLFRSLESRMAGFNIIWIHDDFHKARSDVVIHNHRRL
jgi:hypothetical protein